MSSDLYQLRIQAGLSQTELARLSCVTQTTISHIERGIIDPRLSTVTRIRRVIDAYNLARALGDAVSVSESTEGAGFSLSGGQNNG